MFSARVWPSRRIVVNHRICNAACVRGVRDVSDRLQLVEIGTMQRSVLRSDDTTGGEPNRRRRDGSHSYADDLAGWAFPPMSGQFFQPPWLRYVSRF